MPYKDKEKIKERKREWYLNHRGERLEKMKQWRFKHPEYKKQYRIDNPERGRRYREDHKKTINEYHKKWYLDHKESQNEKSRQWQVNHPKQIKAYRKQYMKQWRQTPKGKAVDQRGKVKRKTREKEVINTLTAQEWLDILEKCNYRCAYCGCDFDENTLPTRDHIIPISKDGDNIKENIIPACQSCNSRKGDKIVKPLVNRNCLAEKARRCEREQLSLLELVG